MEFIITKTEENKRLDQFLFTKDLNLSRSQIQKLVKDGNITVNGKIVKPGLRIKEKDKVKVDIPAPKKLETVPENIPLDIVYEDKDLIVVNKPRGMVVHPAAGNYSGTLVNALLYHCKDLSGIGGVERPGIVHRLDKDTSGLIVIAKNDFTHNALVKQFKNREINKVYLAIVQGIPDEKKGTITMPISRHKLRRKQMSVGVGREAETHYKVVKTFGNCSLLEVTPKTGRTHQIRVHLSYIGYPIVGDSVYGKAPRPLDRARGSGQGKGQMLHAFKLGFIHPRSGKYIEFERMMPEDMKELVSNIARTSPQ